jgi:hypothetical protein
MLNNADIMITHNITKPELSYQGNDNLFIYILNIIMYIYIVNFARFH